MVRIAVTVVTGRSRTRARVWAWVEAAVGAVVLVVLLLRFGSAPVLAALGRLHWWVIVAAVAVSACGTLCVAYRWRLVTVALAVPVGYSRAVGAYYGSQFLNSTLPGGVLGDVHRGLSHTHDGHPLGVSLRSVAWERLLGQAVQIALTAAVLLVAPSALDPPRSAPQGWPALAVLGSTVVTLAVLASVGPPLLRRTRRRPAGRMSGHLPGRRALRAVAEDWRRVAAMPGALPRIVLASAGALAATVSVFLLAVHTVAPHLELLQVVPVALVVLLVAALPLNLAGWGPREGAAAWAFGAAGWGAEQGLGVSVVFGVLALLGTLPGAAVLLARRRGGRPHG